MIARVIDPGSDRASWLRARSLGVGASEVPILFGCGYAESSLLDLYARKVSANVEPIEETEGMGWGKRLEGVIIEETATRAEVTVTRNSSLFANDDYPHLVCTPDGLTSGEPAEVKNICHLLNEDEWESGIPEIYNLQVQSQIAVLGSTRGLFGALLFGGRLVWGWIQRDDALIVEINRRVEEFWRCVEARTPPASNGSKSARQAALALAESNPPVEFFESEIGDLLEQWSSLSARERACKSAYVKAESDRKSIEDSLIQRMGVADKAVTSTGWTFQKTETQRRGYTVEPKTIKGFRVIPPKE